MTRKFSSTGALRGATAMMVTPVMSPSGDPNRRRCHSLVLAFAGERQSVTAG
ncbi:MAG TPA: hypothetical protein VEF55_14450 [Candidatus Binatia bacterium]|nr:hypothetical protein [Candidatus Binatia bacterium]